MIIHDDQQSGNRPYEFGKSRVTKKKEQNTCIITWKNTISWVSEMEIDGDYFDNLSMDFPFFFLWIISTCSSCWSVAPDQIGESEAKGADGSTSIVVQHVKEFPRQDVWPRHQI